MPHTKRATGNPTLLPNAHIIDTASGSKALSPRATSHFRHRQALSILKSRRVKAIGMQIPPHSQRPPYPNIIPQHHLGRTPDTHIEPPMTSHRRPQAPQPNTKSKTPNTN